MDSNPYRSRLNGLDWSATPIQSSHSIANTASVDPYSEQKILRFCADVCP